MGKSLKLYFTALGHWGWVVVADFFAVITGVILDVSGTWHFPTWLWLGMLALALLIAPFKAFHTIRLKLDERQHELDEIRNASPCVEFDGPSPATTPIYSPDSNGKWVKRGQGYFVRLAFKNKAQNPSGLGSTAQATTAHITLFDSQGDRIDDWEGRWATLDEPTSYGQIRQSNTYDIQANGQQAIVDIVSLTRAFEPPITTDIEPPGAGDVVSSSGHSVNSFLLCGDSLSR